MPKGQHVYEDEVYVYISEIVETDYGPENKVSIFKNFSLIGVRQEAASTATIVAWFFEDATLALAQ